MEDALVLKIVSECRCSFNKSYLLDSNVECGGNNQLIYTANVEYSTDDGSETASVIADRIVRQVPFSMSFGESQFTVTSAQCNYCDATEASGLSSADGGGLFFGGFIVAAVIGIILVIIA